MTMKARAKKCMTEGCKSDAKFRGLCIPCYRTAWRRVRAGKDTWEEMESKGIAGQRSTVRSTPLSRKLAKSK